MTGGATDDHDAAMPEAGFGRVVISVGLAVERGFIADEQRLVAASQPETVTAVVGLVADVRVARTPRLDAVVVSVGGVVLHEGVSARHPAVEHPNENAVSALGDIVAEPKIVVRAALEEHAGRVPRMHLAGRAVDANAIGKVVPQKTVARR